MDGSESLGWETIADNNCGATISLSRPLTVVVVAAGLLAVARAERERESETTRRGERVSDAIGRTEEKERKATLLIAFAVDVVVA